MKTILLVRHAKSSWENFSVADIDRPLNDRGKKNAPDMAARLMKKNIKIDAFISSPAKRARSTAKLFAETYGADPTEIIIVPELYEPNGTAFLEAIRRAPKNASTIALFSHNPGITAFANTTTTTRIDDMPTCSTFALTAMIGSWSDFEPGKNEFYFFDYPRSH